MKLENHGVVRDYVVQNAFQWFRVLRGNIKLNAGWRAEVATRIVFGEYADEMVSFRRYK